MKRTILKLYYNGYKVAETMTVYNVGNNLQYEEPRMKLHVWRILPYNKK